MSVIIVEQCNFIIIGAWNPAIIHPHWLKSQFPTIIKGDQFGVELVTGPTATFRYDINKVLISPNHDRLVFIPKEINEDSLDFISKICCAIFEKLPHTPVFAAGCNFVYQLNENEVFYISELEVSAKESEFYRGIDLKDITTKQTRHCFSFSDYNLNISYNLSRDNKTVHYNFDYPLKDNRLIIKAAESLKDHFDRTVQLNAKLIREK